MSLIQKRILERRITQVDLARRLSVSPQSVSAWILRTRIPKPRTMKKIADELGVGVEKLLADFCG